MKAVPTLVILGFSLFIAACGLTVPDVEDTTISTQAIICSLVPQHAHQSSTNRREIAGKGGGHCTNTNSPLAGSARVTTWVSLQKRVNGSWINIATQSPGVTKTIISGQTQVWTNRELRVFAPCSSGTWRTVLHGRTSAWIELGLPKYGVSRNITC